MGLSNLLKLSIGNLMCDERWEIKKYIKWENQIH